MGFLADIPPSGVIGNTSSDATSYTITNPVKNQTISTTSHSTLVTAVNSEVARRSKGSSYTQTYSNPINYTDINAIRNAIGIAVTGLRGNNAFYDRFGYHTYEYYRFDNGTGQGNNFPGALDTGNSSSSNVTWTYGTAYFTQASAYSPTAAVQNTGDVIYAKTFVDLATDVNGAAAVCVCNCNYCTCNCNYCTCNCNYKCTCNCNYSDERLKENITLIGENDGINIYEYTYIWDKMKKFQGVMAQELLNTKYSSAVITATNGYYAVDYSQLPVEFKEV